MASMVQPALPPAALSGTKEALACTVLGTILSTGVYGISILQAYIYFRNSRQDSTYMRTFVTFLFILDTISMAMTVNGLYDYVVTDFGDPLALLRVPPVLAFEDGVTFLVGMLTQSFFAHRLWALSKRNITVVGCIIILALCSFGAGMALSVQIYVDREIFSLGSLEMRIIAGFANGLSAMCDIAITAMLCYYLHSKRTGFKRTDSMINLLIIYAVNRGALTAICQVGVTITFIALPERFIFVPLGLVGGRLYCNTLLATLNAQKSMGHDGTHIVEFGTQILNQLNTSTAENGNNRSPAGRQLESSSNSTPTFVLDISAEKTADAEHTPTVYRDV